MAGIPRGRVWCVSNHLCRNVSAIATKEQPILQHTGIPIIVPPHAVKKAFVVHPKSRAVYPSLKYQWLTKTVMNEGLPSSATASNLQLDILPNEMQNLTETFRGSLTQTLGFQKEPKKSKKRFELEIQMGVFQDLLRLCWPLSHSWSPTLKDTYLDLSPKVHTHWVRRHEFYQLLYYPDLILRSKEKRELFEQDVQSTMAKHIPGPYDSYSMEVYLHPIVHLRNFPGYHQSSCNPYLHNHTLFLADIRDQTIDQVHAYGIMSMFGVLAATAMNQGVKVGEHLDMPLTTQCVISDGTQIVLMCYQLNTLSLQEDYGIKNCAWGTDHMPFFTTTNDNNNTRKWRPMLYNTLNIENNLPNVNEECIRSLIYFFIH